MGAIFSPPDNPPPPVPPPVPPAATPATYADASVQKAGANQSQRAAAQAAAGDQGQQKTGGAGPVVPTAKPSLMGG